MKAIVDFPVPAEPLSQNTGGPESVASQLAKRYYAKKIAIFTSPGLNFVNHINPGPFGTRSAAFTVKASSFCVTKVDFCNEWSDRVGLDQNSLHTQIIRRH